MSEQFCSLAFYQKHNIMNKILLLMSVFSVLNITAQECSELFISEYVEGPHNNNAIEIYNPTNASIDLSDYTIKRYSNGDNNPANADTWQLSGLINLGEAVAIGNGQLDSIWITSGSYWSIPVDPVFYAACNLHGSGIYPTPFYFNGDDAITLEKNNIPVDIFGKVGEDPGGAWTDDPSANPPFSDNNGGDWWTKRQTLIRKASVKQGVTVNPLEFNPTLEYDSLPDGTYGNLGTHICDCNPTGIDNLKIPSYVMYPNPVNLGGTVLISSNKKIKTVEIINVIANSITYSKSNYIPTVNLTKGTYIVNIIFNNETQVSNTLIIQ